jgi:pimeloyl-ACP methyl ester carboxylesterase
VPLAENLTPDYTMVVPDLRGMGLSAKPAGGKKRKADTLQASSIFSKSRRPLVTHDIGNMPGCAFAAQYRDRVTRFVLIDAPFVPETGPVDPFAPGHQPLHIRATEPEMP